MLCKKFDMLCKIRQHMDAMYFSDANGTPAKDLGFEDIRKRKYTLFRVRTRFGAPPPIAFEIYS